MILYVSALSFLVGAPNYLMDVFSSICCCIRFFLLDDRGFEVYLDVIFYLDVVYGLSCSSYDYAILFLFPFFMGCVIVLLFFLVIF